MTKETHIKIAEQLKVRTTVGIAFACVSACCGAAWETKGMYDDLKNADTEIATRMLGQVKRIDADEERIKRLEATQADIMDIKKAQEETLRLLRSERQHQNNP